MVKIIGIGEYAVSDNKEDIIKTFALGSCVALVIYNPMLKRLGMVHIALPESSILKWGTNNQKLGYFADIAVPFIFQKVCNGLSNYNENFKVSLYGGASSRNGDDVFKIGQKNLIKIKSILEEKKINYDITNTGGFFSRTVEIDVATGILKIGLQPMKIL